jgi:GT2 family glycosyltransferase
MSGSPELPAMSVVMVTPSHVGDLGLPLRGLSAQTVRHELELILVTPADESAADHASWLTGFHSVSIVRVRHVRSRGAAAAAGVRAARAEIVALMENHVFPEPDWAEQILRAHQGPWMAIGPRVNGLNLRSWTSRAYRMVFYGRLSARDQPRETEHLPWHNGTYKSRLLQPFANQLEDLLDHEERFHQMLLAHGYRLYYWPGARLRHANVSRPGRALQLAFYTGRVFASERNRDWPWRRRLLYAAGWPLFPWIRLAQMREDIQRIARQEPTWFLLPLGVLLLHLLALGEAIGYLVGPGRASEWLDRNELCRWDERMTRADVNEVESLAGRAPA